MGSGSWEELAPFSGYLCSVRSMCGFGRHLHSRHTKVRPYAGAIGTSRHDVAERKPCAHVWRADSIVSSTVSRGGKGTLLAGDCQGLGTGLKCQGWMDD